MEKFFVYSSVLIAIIVSLILFMLGCCLLKDFFQDLDCFTYHIMDSLLNFLFGLVFAILGLALAVGTFVGVIV